MSHNKSKAEIKALQDGAAFVANFMGRLLNEAAFRELPIDDLYSLLRQDAIWYWPEIIECLRARQQWMNKRAHYIDVVLRRLKENNIPATGDLNLPVGEALWIDQPGDIYAKHQEGGLVSIPSTWEHSAGAWRKMDEMGLKPGNSLHAIALFVEMVKKESRVELVSLLDSWYVDGPTQRLVLCLRKDSGGIRADLLSDSQTWPAYTSYVACRKTPDENGRARSLEDVDARMQWYGHR